VSSVQQRSPYLLNRLHELGNEPLVGDVRGVGLLGGVELVKEPATRKKFDPKAGVAAELVRRAQARGVLLRALGGDVVVFCPPLISEKSQIDVMMSVFVEALHDTARWLSTQQ
jgi:4-aminobutyrate--pyruvate transaminase